MDVAAAPADRSFATDRALLLDAFQEVVRRSESAAVLELHERAVELGRRARGGDDAAADELAELVADARRRATLELLVRSLTRWFQLINLAEDNERVRRLRAREAARGARAAPRLAARRDRAASPRAGIERRRAARRCSPRAEVRLVHDRAPDRGAPPHDAREARARLRACCATLDERPPVPGEPRRAGAGWPPTIQELWGSDELRAVSPTVLDEVRTGLVYFISTLADVVPAVYRDLEAALRGAYPRRGRRGAAAADASARGWAATATATRTSRPR